MEIAPNMAVLGLMKYNNTKPIIVSKLATNKARFGDILFAGTGRFFVLSINASKSFSITWLNALLAPTIQYPPRTNKSTTDQLNGCVVELNPNKYPANDEKTTLTASRALVISRKSLYVAFMEKVGAVAFNLLLFLFVQRYDLDYIIKD